MQRSEFIGLLLSPLLAPLAALKKEPGGELVAVNYGKTPPIIEGTPEQILAKLMMNEMSRKMDADLTALFPGFEQPQSGVALTIRKGW